MTALKYWIRKESAWTRILGTVLVGGITIIAFVSWLNSQSKLTLASALPQHSQIISETNR